MSNYCREALTIATALIHPIVPSIEVAAKSLIFTNYVVQETSTHHEEIIIESPEKETTRMLNDSIQNSQKNVDSNHNQCLAENESAFSKIPQSVAQKTIDEQTLHTNIVNPSMNEQLIDSSSYQTSTASNKNNTMHVDSSNSTSRGQTETNGQMLYRTIQDNSLEEPGTLVLDVSCSDGVVNVNSETKDDVNEDIIPAKRTKTDDYSSIEDKVKEASDTEGDEQHQEIQVNTVFFVIKIAVVINCCSID